MDHSTSVPTLGFAGSHVRGMYAGCCPDSPASSSASPAKASSASSQSGCHASFGIDAMPPVSSKRQRARPMTMLDLRSNSPEDSAFCSLDADVLGGNRSSSRSPFGKKERERARMEEQGGPSTPSARLPLGLANRKPRGMALSGSLLSLRSMSDHSLPCADMCPDSPGPRRDEFHQPPGGAVVVFFDFDGTLTSTPGDRAARRTKREELVERAPMLEQRLRAMRAEGASLGIISKSSESTIRGALDASGLTKYFDAPLVAKAVGFEGKAGFIEELAQKGCLPRLGSARGHVVAFHRILLVDDDVLELERARSHGMQCYSAPAEGGLQDEDFDIIIEALRMPRPKSHPQQHCSSPKHLPMAPPLIQKTPSSAPSFPGAGSMSRRHLRKSPAKEEPLRLPAFQDLGRPGGRWKNMIVFSGDCFEG
eukprot:TRINITY_DN23069_c0_g1_i1.p1 TRINITY_DN23069_c0_g1~~TRINITY_DN23069_c0_g1_i1.p1  ORF type:complete len:423 (-),score=71.14 TRINITY_DN23069_c0_g1_i1:266-1534(-)